MSEQDTTHQATDHGEVITGLVDGLVTQVVAKMEASYPTAYDEKALGEFMSDRASVEAWAKEAWTRAKHLIDALDQKFPRSAAKRTPSHPVRRSLR